MYMQVGNHLPPFSVRYGRNARVVNKITLRLRSKSLSKTRLNLLRQSIPQTSIESSNQ